MITILPNLLLLNISFTRRPGMLLRGFRIAWYLIIALLFHHEVVNSHA